VRDKIRFKHYSISTEKTYVHWITHYILFNDKKHPKDMGKRDIEKFLTHLLEHGINIRTIQELLGHKSVDTTMIYIHVVAEMNKEKVVSPLDI
jgi:hypothetical protein